MARDRRDELGRVMTRVADDEMALQWRGQLRSTQIAGDNHERADADGPRAPSTRAPERAK